MKKKVWVNSGDIVLISLREFQDEKGDVILKYTPDEARELKLKKELPENAKINDVDVAGGFESGGEDDIEFQEEAGLNIEDVNLLIMKIIETHQLILCFLSDLDAPELPLLHSRNSLCFIGFQTVIVHFILSSSYLLKSYRILLRHTHPIVICFHTVQSSFNSTTLQLSSELISIFKFS